MTAISVIDADIKPPGKALGKPGARSRQSRASASLPRSPLALSTIPALPRHWAHPQDAIGRTRVDCLAAVSKCGNGRVE